MGISPNKLVYVAHLVKSKMDTIIQQNIISSPPRDAYRLLHNQVLESTAGKVEVSYLTGVYKFGWMLNWQRSAPSNLPPQPKGWKDLANISDVFKMTLDGRVEISSS